MEKNYENKSKSLFVMFCIWAFVLLCRPQDLFPALSVIRPVLLTGILTLIFVVLHLKDNIKPCFFKERQVQYYTALLLIMVIGIPFSFYPGRSFRLLFTGYVNVALFFYVFYLVVDSTDKLFVILRLACIGSGLYSAFSVVSGTFVSGRLYFGGVFDPNDLAFFALSFLPLNLLFVSRDNPLWARLACLASFGVGVLLILLVGSRGGMLAFAVVVILLLLNKHTISPFLKLSFVVMCMVFISTFPVNLDRYKTIISLEDDYNIKGEEGRLAIWAIGMNAMLANPLTGVGVGCFEQAVGRAREKKGTGSSAWQAPHSVVVQIGTETGLLGLALFLLVSANVLRIFRKAKKTVSVIRLVKIAEMGTVGFSGFFVSGLFLSQAYSLYWVFYIAFSAVFSRLVKREMTTVQNS